MPGFFNKLLGKDPEGRAKSGQVLANLDSPSSIPKLITALGDEAVEVRRPQHRRWRRMAAPETQAR